MPFACKEDYNEYHRRWRAGEMRSGRPTRRKGEPAAMRKQTDWPFAFVDGEGGNLPDGSSLFGTRHEYLMLRAGSDGPVLSNGGKPLRTKECLAFLADLPKTKLYISYFFDYDVTMMLKGLTPERMARVLRRTSQMKDVGDNEDRDIVSAYAPVDIDGEFEIRYLPGKHFAVRRAGKKQYTVVSDMGPFFGCSFLRAIGDWDIGTRAQRDAIARGKEQRDKFGHLTQDTEEYNRLEAELGEALAEEFRSACVDLGYVPRAWEGPGQLAGAMLEAHRVPRRRDIPAMENNRLRALANAAYYGGRFETMAVGPVPGPVREYDICSAYPDAMRRLPCLLHGTWERRTKWYDDEPLYFAHIGFDHPDSPFVCNLPVRSRDGGLYWPTRGEGVYWSVEIDAAVRAGTVVTAKHEAYVYRPGRGCACAPFDFIPDLYRYRRALGKTSKGRALKLGMNSLYGKLAQSVGSPPWANPVWAGLITAWTRAALVDCYAGRQRDVLMIATDAVYFAGAAPMVVMGSDLGQWEETVHDQGLFIVQPGLYYEGTWMTEGECLWNALVRAHDKTRGMNPAVFASLRTQFGEAFARMLENDDPSEAVSAPVHQFTGLQFAVHLRQYARAGQWTDESRRFSFDWRGKRGPALVLDNGIHRTLPIVSAEAVKSVAYRRTIGGYAPELDRLARREQPDWAPLFFHS